jgi:hypothetical protein
VQTGIEEPNQMFYQMFFLDGVGILSSKPFQVIFLGHRSICPARRGALSVTCNNRPYSVEICVGLVQLYWLIR